MAIPASLIAEIQELARAPEQWFSIDEIRRRDPDLHVAARYVRKDTNAEWVIPADPQTVYEKLEGWAIRLMDREVRLVEVRIWEVCSENSVTPDTDDDTRLSEHLCEWIQSCASELATAIKTYAKCGQRQWPSNLERAAKRLLSELSVTIPLAAELARLEMIEHAHNVVDSLAFAQNKIISFFYKTYTRIPHPFTEEDARTLPGAALQQAVRLLTHVVYKRVAEPRLRGVAEKFSNVFVRYLSCSRESSAVVVEQVCGLFEPFLKKLAFILGSTDAKGRLLWYASLDGLISGLALSLCDLRRTDPAYWRAQATQDAIFRIAYQLRQKVAHEAHEYPYYESERQAFNVFAAMVLSCAIVLQSHPEMTKVVADQETADALRDLLVRIDDLTIDPEGNDRLPPERAFPPNRLEKLVDLGARAQVILPTCSGGLLDLLRTEYSAVRSELTDADREAVIESYNESMRDWYNDR